MAIATPTNRGSATIDSASTATATMVSNTFIPATGEYLVAMVGGLSTTTGITFSASDTFGDTGGTSWAETTIVDNNYTGAGYTCRCSIFYRRVGVGAASGAATITRSGGTILNAFDAQFMSLVANGTLSFIQSATGQVAPGGGTCTVTLAATPYPTGVLFGTITGGSFNTAVTQPTNHTEIREVVRDTNGLTKHEYTYQNGPVSGTNPAIAPAWTNCDPQGDDYFAVVIEVNESPVTRTGYGRGRLHVRTR